MYNHLENIFVCVLLLICFSCTQQQETNVVIQSPDTKIEVNFELQDQHAFYSVQFNGINIIDPSKLGFEFKNQPPLSGDFTIKNVSTQMVNEDWEQVWGEIKTVNNSYNEAIIELEEAGKLKRKFNIVFRVFNDGIGFSYVIPEQKNLDSMYVTDELTEFNLSTDFTTWYIPANFDSYEAIYQNTPASEVESANTPITFESEDIFISIHEANLTNYAGMTLKKMDHSKLGFQADLVPWPDGIKVKTVAPLQTPWRTIQITRSAGELIESSLILNLNEPNKLEEVSWIKPCKYIGIWWGMHLGTHTWTIGERHGATTERMKQYIDFAAENNIDAVLAEGWSTGWEEWGQAKAFDFVTPYPDFDLKEIVDYADQKSVNIIGHHETGGDAQYYEQKMHAAFELYQSLGIHYLKTGYAGAIRPVGQYHHGQFMVNHYRKIIETAAKYKLTVNVHEPIKATGIRRTYPNMMSREGARGMEWNAWSAGNSPEHHVILPFTRILAGPLDYTPGIFDILYENAGERIKWNDQDKGDSRVNTTLSKQLALYVVFYSPLQMASDLIENYKEHPAFQFISEVPVNWEETKVLNAKIGDYLTIVRKDIDSKDWFLGAVTDENARELEIELNFLDTAKKYIAEIYTDTEESDWVNNPVAYQVLSKQVSSDDFLLLKLAPGGGQAIRFKAL